MQAFAGVQLFSKKEFAKIKLQTRGGDQRNGKRPVTKSLILWDRGWQVALVPTLFVKKIAVDLAQMPRGNPVCRIESSEYR
jgi:hypothetical protein